MIELLKCLNLSHYLFNLFLPLPTTKKKTNWEPYIELDELPSSL